MAINKFLEKNKSKIIKIISTLDTTFTSHEFLKKFAKEFESDYIAFLGSYSEDAAFRNVHSQIARFLSDNSKALSIIKTHKVPSENVFGKKDEIQGWEKV